ncbi:MAG: 5-bromo-4-chloroindolyl phosphate hydrolysis family protein [Lachnospiraceae bacterium]|nr:5-bromo-4-chloroindolyl phosphate hydrolysis family protein [Lachnospiraceae bacterium]
MNDFGPGPNFGDQIKKALGDALQSGDYTRLNSLVAGSANRAINEAEKHLDKLKAKTSESHDIPVWQQRADIRARGGKVEPPEVMLDGIFNAFNSTPSKRKDYLFQKKGLVSGFMSRFWGVMFEIFGGIFVLAALVDKGIDLGAFIGGLGVFALGFLMFARGSKKRKRVRIAETLYRDSSLKGYVDLDIVSADIGIPRNKLVIEIQKILEKGMFPQGHLDATGSTFILTDEAYSQYLQAENSRRQREDTTPLANDSKSANSKNKNNSKNQNKQAASDNTSKTATDNGTASNTGKTNEISTMINEGRVCIEKLHRLNDDIEGEVISQKLYTLEGLLKQIFERLSDEPTVAPKLHKMMDYYLPTTLKMVEAYRDFDKIERPGKEITKAKEEIENTLDTINSSFTELLNGLFEESAWDVTTDAQVLQTMLKKEGLVKNEDGNILNM